MVIKATTTDSKVSSPHTPVGFWQKVADFAVGGPLTRANYRFAKAIASAEDTIQHMEEKQNASSETTARLLAESDECLARVRENRKHYRL